MLMLAFFLSCGGDVAMMLIFFDLTDGIWVILLLFYLLVVFEEYIFL